MEQRGCRWRSRVRGAELHEGVEAELREEALRRRAEEERARGVQHLGQTRYPGFDRRRDTWSQTPPGHKRLKRVCGPVVVPL